MPGLPSSTTTMTVAQLAFDSFIEPAQGFHFVITTRIRSKPPPDCTALGLRFILPSSVFADPYELDLHHHAFNYTLSPKPDLELPVSAVGSGVAILEVNATASQLSDASSSVAVPIHARYGRPRSSRDEGFGTVRLDPPTAVLFCGPEGTRDYSSTRRSA